jgi:ParB/RepB/Spo0J family partition protein
LSSASQKTTDGDDRDSPFPNLQSRLVARAKYTLAKRRSEIVIRDFEHENGPRAEFHTRILYGHSTLIPVSKIIDDPDFFNSRLVVDPVGLTNLQDSIDLEGLKVPIVVVEASAPGYYHVRAGFRRSMAVRNLGWHDVPAIVLPADTPRSEEYWINITENTSREKLTTYELAMAAKTMRDQFGVSPTEFARKTSHAPAYVNELLGCLDRLPAEVYQSWKNNEHIPFSIYVKLSMMTPLEAVKNLRLWKGQHRIDDYATLAGHALEKRRERKRDNDKSLTIRGIERTQRLMVALRSSKLSPEAKRVAIEIVEYVQGCRKRVDGVIHDGWRSQQQGSLIEDQEFELMMSAKIQDLRRENAKDNKTEVTDDEPQSPPE